MGGRRKNKNNKKSRLRWVPKVPKPISNVMLAEPEVRLEVGSSRALDYGGLEKPPAVSELSGGSCPLSLTSGFSALENQSSRLVQGPLPEYVAVAMEDGVGPSEMMGTFPAIPEVFGGSFSSTIVPELASLVSQPEPSSGVVSSVLVWRPISQIQLLWSTLR
jgi:hypothetical protein